MAIATLRPAHSLRGDSHVFSFRGQTAAGNEFLVERGEPVAGNEAVPLLDLMARAAEAAREAIVAAAEKADAAVLDGVTLSFDRAGKVIVTQPEGKV